MFVKVKNTLKKKISIRQFNNESIILQVGEEKILGEYDDKYRPNIYKLLLQGLYVSKIDSIDNVNTNIDIKDEKVKQKKRGRPKKVR